MTIEAQDLRGETVFKLGMGTIMSVFCILFAALFGWNLNLQIGDSNHSQKIAVLEQVQKTSDAAVCEVKKNVEALIKAREQDRALLEEIRSSQKKRGY